MTCIAYDGKTIASDSLRNWSGEVVPRHVTKVFEHSHFIVGIAGKQGFAGELFNHWQSYIDKGDTFPHMRCASEVDCSLLIVCRDTKRCWLVTGDGSCTEVTGHPMSIGSGALYARGAMLAGASATRAVEIAIECETSCGGPITNIEV